MTLDAFLRSLETTLGRPPGTLSVDSRLDELDWDSMAELTFISMADAKLGVQVPAGELAKCATVGDLVQLVRQGVAA